MFTSQSVVQRRSEPLAADVADEVVMLDPEQGRYFALDAVGKRVWELLENPIPVAELARALVKEFQVDDATCTADVLAFLGELQSAGLLRPT